MGLPIRYVVSCIREDKEEKIEKTNDMHTDDAQGRVPNNQPTSSKEHKNTEDEFAKQVTA